MCCVVALCCQLLGQRVEPVLVTGPASKTTEGWSGLALPARPGQVDQRRRHGTVLVEGSPKTRHLLVLQRHTPCTGKGTPAWAERCDTHIL